LVDTRAILGLPEEPADLRAKTRALLEDLPEEGTGVIGDAAFVADLLWGEWGEDLAGAGMNRDRFLEIARGYSGVVGERSRDHCVAGLAGRVRRRLPALGAAVSRR
jgi:hypothetical protein